jgi:hypothetical protein
VAEEDSAVVARSRVEERVARLGQARRRLLVPALLERFLRHPTKSRF